MTKKIVIALMFAWLTAAPLFTFAAEENVPILQRRGLGACLMGVSEPGKENRPQEWKIPPGSCTVEQILTFASSIMDWMVAVSGAVALLMFVLGGVWMIFSAGNSSRVERGKDILTGTSIALIFILGSWVLVQFALQSLGAKQEFLLTDLQCGSNGDCPTNTTCVDKRCRDQCYTQTQGSWQCIESPGSGGCIPNICRNAGDVCCPPQQ